MSKIIIVTGHLAALKSTISHRLSEDLKITVLNKDTMKEVLGESIGFQNREENLRLSHATYDMIKYLLKKAIELNQNIIIESNFKRHELNDLKKLLTTFDCKSLTLFCTGDSNILYERYVKRQPFRHKVHTSTGLLSYEVFSEVMKEYHIDDCFYHKVIIDTTHFNDENYQDIINHVNLFINN